MDHRGGIEAEHGAAEVESVAFAHSLCAVAEVAAGKEGGQHAYGLLRAYEGHSGPALHGLEYAGRMVRLHVVDHQVIGLTARRGLEYVLHPDIAVAGFHGVHHRDFVGQDCVAVVAHAVVQHKLFFKKVGVGVIYANAGYAGSDLL